tara:strand:+ start:565 stop:921 length:357 start_codon:yes stop_codon:yes gene_type:complete
MPVYRMFVEGTVIRPIIIKDAKDLKEAKRRAINEWANLTGGSLDTGRVTQSWVVSGGNGHTLIHEQEFTSIADELHQKLREIVCQEIDVVLDENNDWLNETIKNIVLKTIKDDNKKGG